MTAADLWLPPIAIALCLEGSSGRIAANAVMALGSKRFVPAKIFHAMVH